MLFENFFILPENLHVRSQRWQNEPLQYVWTTIKGPTETDFILWPSVSNTNRQRCIKLSCKHIDLSSLNFLTVPLIYRLHMPEQWIDFQQGQCLLQVWPVKAQHPLGHFLPPPESPGCSGNLQYWNRWLDRLTHWCYSGGKYLRRLKWTMCQHSTSLQATDWGRETLLVSRLVDSMIDRWGKPQSAFSAPKYRGSHRGDCHGQSLISCLSFVCQSSPQTSEERGRHRQLSLKMNDHTSNVETIVKRGHIQTWNTMFWRMIDCVLNLAPFNYWAIACRNIGNFLISQLN